jgi:hypothetical protein
MRKMGFTWALLAVTVMLVSCECEDLAGFGTGSLTVTIVDETPEPVPGVEVKVFNSTEHTMMTDSSGTCTLSDLKTIDTMVRIKKAGYKRIYDSFTLSEGVSERTYTLTPIEELYEGFETGTFSGEWTLSGDGDWTVVAGSAHSGDWCAQSGSIGTYEQCSIARMLEVEAEEMTLSFWYKVAADWYDHFLEFRINDVLLLNISGYYDWQEYATTLTEGEYQLKWTFNKRYSGSGESVVWLDDIRFTE